MTRSYESVARTWEQQAPEPRSFHAMHPHPSQKIIPFVPAAASAVHPSMAGRHRRYARRCAFQHKLFVVLPRYLCVALLTLAFFAQLALMPLPLVSVCYASAFVLAGISTLFARSFKESHS